MIAIVLGMALAAAPIEAVPTQDKKNLEEIKVTVDVENGTVGETLDSLRLISGVPIELDEAAAKKADLTGKLSFKVKDVTLLDALKLLFGPRGLDVTVVEKRKILVRLPKDR